MARFQFCDIRKRQNRSDSEGLRGLQESEGREGGSERQSAEDFQGSERPLCDTVIVDTRR